MTTRRDVMKRFVLLTLLVFLAGCGVAAPTADQPTAAPQIIKEVVTQIVVVTQVVTATPKPATPTPKATAIPPTATTAPTATPNPIGKWKVTNDTSSFDDSKTVVLE